VEEDLKNVTQKVCSPFVCGGSLFIRSLIILPFDPI
jgi:hypothetical protein